MIFRRKKSDSAVAVADPVAEVAAGRSTEELLAEIEALSRSNRERRDPGVEDRLVTLRHAVGIDLIEKARPGAAYPEPAFNQLPDRNGELAGVQPDQLTPELVRAGILRDGCLLIRGLVERGDAESLRDEIERVFAARD